MLKKPILALSENRNKIAQENTICGNPENWFFTERFREKGINAASFDFFIDWENKRVCDEVWIKRISDSEDIFRQSKEELRDEIIRVDGQFQSRCLYYFLKTQNLKEKYMLFRDVPEYVWENGQERVVELNLSDFSQNAVNYLSVDEIQNRIKELRKQPASIGNAGLIYSTSTLESYLSKKPFFWPGDVDMVLFDKNNKAVAIIEFKKHTAKSKIPFKEQRLSNYIREDKLKYESLGLLRDRLNSQLYVLYYPIPCNINYIWLEKTKGSYDNLYSDGRYRLELPALRDKTSMKAFAEKFLEIIL